MFDASALDGSWTIGTLALNDAGAGTIYLTGLSQGSDGNPYETWAAQSPDTNGRAGRLRLPHRDHPGRQRQTVRPHHGCGELIHQSTPKAIL